jgi:hypothetical protein
MYTAWIVCIMLGRSLVSVWALHTLTGKKGGLGCAPALCASKTLGQVKKSQGESWQYWPWDWLIQLWCHSDNEGGAGMNGYQGQVIRALLAHVPVSLVLLWPWGFQLIKGQTLSGLAQTQSFDNGENFKWGGDQRFKYVNVHWKVFLT